MRPQVNQLAQYTSSRNKAQKYHSRTSHAPAWFLTLAKFKAQLKKLCKGRGLWIGHPDFQGCPDSTVQACPRHVSSTSQVLAVNCSKKFCAD